VKRHHSLTLLVLSFLVFVPAAFAQRPPVTVVQKKPMSVAVGNNLYCAGYIQTSGISTANRIIGAQDEADKYNFAQNDFMYINMGHDKGVKEGDLFSVVRPRGTVKSQWTRKNHLGNYVQEVGVLEVVDVKPTVSVAKIKFSCDAFYLGDLVQLTDQRVSPIAEKGMPLDRFGDESGKAIGRIIMSRDGHEMLSRDFIAYVDLGADDNLRIGDHLTVFRDLERGNINTLPGHEIISSRDYGFGSEKFEGTKFSNQSPRKAGEHAGGQEVKTQDAKNGRPHLTKVVGEAVVLNVKERTATIVITRTGQEIHTGDFVEIK